jgi:uncharacterized protein YndB with AHSA1/START domain
MSDLGKILKTGVVRFERVLPGPIERVWEYLTDIERLPDWFGTGVMEPYEGGVVNFMGGHIRGVVTQWKPPRKLAYTWNVFSPGETESAFPESYLTFELQPRGKDVLLTLTHLPIPEEFESRTAMGWHTFLDMLSGGLRGEEPKPRMDYMEKNAALYGVDFKNLPK